MKVLKLDCPLCASPETYIELDEGFADKMNRVEREFIIAALEQAHGNRSMAARALKMPVYALRHLVLKHGLTTERKSYLTDRKS